MRGAVTSQSTVNKIQLLRSHGKTISEISRELHKSKSVVSKYIQGVKIIPKYYDSLKIKQGGSVQRSKDEWSAKKKEAGVWVKEISKKEKILILASLYWGEGTKSELNIINSDPSMLRVFLSCLREIGVNNSELRASLRLFGDMDKKKAINFWAKSLSIPVNCFIGFEFVDGKKNGKLPYGMCRIRVEKGGRYFKLIMSFIEQIKFLLP